MNINFMQNYKNIFLFSLILIFISLFSYIGKGFNLGIDFSGGLLIEIAKENNDINIEEVRKTLDLNKIKDYEAQYFGSNREVLIKIKIDESSNNKGEQVFSILKDYDSELVLNRTELVGPKVGEELKRSAFIAIFIVLICVLVYISFRFEYLFAIGAIAALTHDLIITFGLISLLNIEFNLTVLAAVLAILGYSLNDTIVVYDRIRENINKKELNKLKDIINISINETLSRTIMTSFTTLVALVSLFLFGGEVMNGFSLTLILGIIIGTYSSIYIAGSLLLLFSKNNTDKKEIGGNKYINKEDGII